MRWGFDSLHLDHRLVAEWHTRWHERPVPTRRAGSTPVKPTNQTLPTESEATCPRGEGTGCNPVDTSVRIRQWPPFALACSSMAERTVVTRDAAGSSPAVPASRSLSPEGRASRWYREGLGSIPSNGSMGLWRNWERNCLASRRLGVRVPSSPPWRVGQIG